MIIKPRPFPNHPDYGAACKQTVTLYNKIPSKSEWYKTVFNASAYLESKKVFQEGRTGVTASNPALLVIPQSADGKVYVDPKAYDALADKTGYWTVRNGDKAYPGTGPDIATATDWSNLTSSNYPGVVTIASVDPKRNLAGAIVHVEAGGS